MALKNNNCILQLLPIGKEWPSNILVLMTANNRLLGNCPEFKQNYIRNGDLRDELNNLFNKKYKFRFDNEWKLPIRDVWFTSPPWKAHNLQELKEKLNFHKSQLNDFNLEEWSSHTRRRNPAGEVCWRVKALVNPEFLTQAWTKFQECLCTYSIISNEALLTKKMVSLHLCEAPGAFITSLNHYLKTHHPDINWKWLASTLNPYHEGNSLSNMITDDRFMFHTLDNWHFGADSTGNLMNWENAWTIIEKAKSLGKVLLVTADGSIDCLHEPDAQEEITSHLHYCEIITALQTLSQGGTLVFKLFTMFEHSTVSLLYLINHFFGEVNIYKPVTSRQGNSEVYAVCLDYKGSQKLEPYIAVLKSVYGTELYGNLSLFPFEAIPESFLQQIEECASYFCSIQCQVINENLQAYLMQNNISFHTNIKKLRAAVAAEYIRLYDLRPLPYEYEILKGALHEENKMNTNPRFHRGSYTERQLYSTMSLREKLQNIHCTLLTDILANPSMYIDMPSKWLCIYDYDKNYELKLSFQYGNPIIKVNSSKFIFMPIFRLYQQILSENEFKMILGQDDNVYTENSDHINKQFILPLHSNSDQYSIYEKKSLATLCDILNDLSMGDTLSIDNFNLLTHFNVSILFVLAKKCFEKICFTCTGRIILYNLMDKNAFSYLDEIRNECDRVQSSGTKDVLNSLPVQMTNTGEFFSIIVLYNNTVYKNKCVEYIKRIEQTI